MRDLNLKREQASLPLKPWPGLIRSTSLHLPYTIARVCSIRQLLCDRCVQPCLLEIEQTEMAISTCFRGMFAVEGVVSFVLVDGVIAFKFFSLYVCQ